MRTRAGFRGLARICEIEDAYLKRLKRALTGSVEASALYDRRTYPRLYVRFDIAVSVARIWIIACHKVREFVSVVRCNLFKWGSDLVGRGPGVDILDC